MRHLPGLCLQIAVATGMDDSFHNDTMVSSRHGQPTGLGTWHCISFSQPCSVLGYALMKSRGKSFLFLRSFS